MKTKQLNKQNFAKFILSKSIKLKDYYFDSFYDIHFMLENSNNLIKEYVNKHKTYPTNEKIYITFHWFVRDTGTNIIFTEIDNIKCYTDNNKDYYKITLLLNYEYFCEQYATIEKIK